MKGKYNNIIVIIIIITRTWNSSVIGEHSQHLAIYVFPWHVVRSNPIPCRAVHSIPFCVNTCCYFNGAEHGGSPNKKDTKTTLNGHNFPVEGTTKISNNAALGRFGLIVYSIVLLLLLLRPLLLLHAPEIYEKIVKVFFFFCVIDERNKFPLAEYMHRYRVAALCAHDRTKRYIL